MELYDFNKLIDSKIKKNTKTSIAIGVFEAFHKGHQRVMDCLLEEKKSSPNSEAMVITFSVNPKPGREGAIDTLRLREENLALYGIDCCVTIDFSKHFSKISASEFLQMVLSAVRLEALAVGEDFQFGNPSECATAYDLSAMLTSFGSSAKVNIVAPILMEGGEKISSTLLRRMIKEGRLEEFPKLSGQYYTLDLLKSPYRFNGECLVYRTMDIHQLLPPQGAYDSTLVFESGEKVSSRLYVKDGFFELSLNGFNPQLDDKMCPKFKIDKLLLEKRR